MNEYNVKALNDGYKNAHIAMQSLADILPAVEDKHFKEHLLLEYRAYESIIAEFEDYMLKNNLNPKDINVLKKMMLWTSIKMKTFMDNSKNQIAEMMIKGTVMGVNELTAMLNEQKNLDEGVKTLLQKLLSLEEKYQEELKKFL